MQGVAGRINACAAQPHPLKTQLEAEPRLQLDGTAAQCCLLAVAAGDAEVRVHAPTGSRECGSNSVSSDVSISL